jgi:hypothetical protein
MGDVSQAAKQIDPATQAKLQQVRTMMSDMVPAKTISPPPPPPSGDNERLRSVAIDKPLGRSR